MAGLRLIVGLGNPGPEHARTRHNAGFWFVDALAEQTGARFGLESKLFGETAKVEIAGQSVWLLKPATFMNLSGKSVAAALRYWMIEPEEMLVASTGVIGRPLPMARLREGVRVASAALAPDFLASASTYSTTAESRARDSLSATAGLVDSALNPEFLRRSSCLS